MESDNELIRRRKRKRFEEWMEGDHVLVQLDARADGVAVPAHLKDNPALTLKVSYRFQGDTSIDEQGIVTYLRFSGDYFACVIPWDALWGLTSGDNETEIWTEDVPKEVLLQIACSKLTDFSKKLFNRKKGEEVPEDCAEAKKPNLCEAKVQPAAVAEVREEETAKSAPRKRPDLKLIK